MGTLSSLPIAMSASRTTILAAPSSKSSLPRRLNIQVRHATFIPRPRRPYTFTQLVTLSDGSAYTIRTTSPSALYRASKDTRNSLLWQPNEKSLRNVELDEAGKLAAFRGRYGRSFDAAASSEADGEDVPEEANADDGMDDLTDLIVNYASQEGDAPQASESKKLPTGGK
ncbi:hypothetical protein E4U55_007673 [Claviceps digitariae]|nr:hypothetical protein E4U55_007673 [Claviceps digitariae]